MKFTTRQERMLVGIYGLLNDPGGYFSVKVLGHACGFRIHEAKEVIPSCTGSDSQTLTGRS